jgi:hypothetical protein
MQERKQHFVAARRIAWIAACLAALAFPPSGKPLSRAESGGVIEPSARLVSLQIQPGSAQIHGIGETQQFVALGGYSDGSVRLVTAAAEWNSSDSNIALVSNEPGSEGRAISVAFGSVAISASFRQLRSAAMLTVSPIWCREPVTHLEQITFHVMSSR